MLWVREKTPKIPLTDWCPGHENGRTLSTIVAVATSAPAVAVTVYVSDEVAAVGVPLITPVDVLNASLCGTEGDRL